MKLPQDRRKFIELIEKGATVTKACQLINIHRSTFYDWIKNDKEFISAYMEAKTICHDETDDAAGYHYHKLVRSGDQRFVRKWLDQQHSEFARKTINITLRKEGEVQVGSGSLDKEELFKLLHAYENTGFKPVSKLDGKLQKEYDEWRADNVKEPPTALENTRDFVLDKVIQQLSKPLPPSPEI